MRISQTLFQLFAISATYVQSSLIKKRGEDCDFKGNLPELGNCDKGLYCTEVSSEVGVCLTYIPEKRLGEACDVIIWNEITKFGSCSGYLDCVNVELGSKFGSCQKLHFSEKCSTTPDCSHIGSNMECLNGRCEKMIPLRKVGDFCDKVDSDEIYGKCDKPTVCRLGHFDSSGVAVYRCNFS